MELLSGEVKKVIYSDSNPSLIYGVEVKTLETIPSIITAKPLNMSLIRVPIEGEIVLLLRAPSSYATGVRNSTDIYYLDIVSAQNSIHHNSVPTVSDFVVKKLNTSGNVNDYLQTIAGNTSTISQPDIDKNFHENPDVKPLQPYTGDVILEGRYGNSLRMSTTPKSIAYSVKQNWSGGKSSSPITILRNHYQNTPTGKINDFSTENFSKDDSIVVLASGQNLNFEQSSKQLTSINSKNINSWKSERWGTTPQILISSGRIVFNSTQKEIIAFAKKGIALSSESNIALEAKNTVVLNSNRIELGNNATQPIILSRDFLTLLGTVTVATPTGPSAPLSTSPVWPQILQAVSQTSFVR